MTSQGAFENDTYAKQSYKVSKKIKNNISKHIAAHLSSILCLVKNQSLLSFNPVMAAKDQAVQMLLHKLASHSKSGYNQIHATVEHPNRSAMFHLSIAPVFIGLSSSTSFRRFVQLFVLKKLYTVRYSSLV